MSASMPSLPEELVEFIAKQLGTIDICSLRATSRLLAAKASRGHFRTALHRKTIALKAESLDKVVHLLEHDDLGRVLCNLTVPCDKQHDGTEHTLACLLNSLTVTCTSGEEHNEESDFPLLHNCFTLFQSGLNGRPLEVLSARLTSEHGTEICASGWKAQSMTAGQLAKGIFLAIHGSGLNVTSLDLFADQDYCSIPISIIRGCADAVRAGVTDPEGVSDTFGSIHTIKRLALSFTYHPGPPLAKNTSIIGQTGALTGIFSSMPHLESLTIHWYKLLTRTQERWDSCVEEGGVHFYPDFLRNSLQRNPLTHLTLSGVHLGAPSSHIHYLVARTWVPILDFMASLECTITSLHLDDLLGHSELVYFKIPGKPKFCRGEDVGPSEVRRTGAEVKVKLEYAFGKGKALRSAKIDEWWSALTRRYGPPDRMM
ncbi:hypothetical protein LTR95_009916 [Oleoguttula sp. CCFEE 5521]